MLAGGGVGRGQAPPPGGGNEASSPPPETPSTAAGAPFLTMVVKSGYDPLQLGRRIAGPSATVHLAPQTPQENMPVGILRATYRVSLQPRHGCEALARAYREEGVRRAYLGAFPGQYPDCWQDSTTERTAAPPPNATGQT
jgi:hypothetical protein